MAYNTRLTEECPLTKEKDDKCKLCACNGLRFIIGCFVVLTFGITAMLVLQILYTESIPQSNFHGIHGAVATDYSNCSQIGTKILRRSGNSVDAAIAATICMAVVARHKTDLSGNGCVMIYNYKNYTHPIVINIINSMPKDGVRLPILLQGLEFVHKSYGSLPWYEIVQPSAKLAREGFVVSKDFVHEVSKDAEYATLYRSLNPGDILKLQDLANTLDIIAEYGAKALHNGTLLHKILQNGLLDEESLQQLVAYRPAVAIAKSSTLHGYTVYYPPHASFMQAVIESLESLPISAENASTIESQALVAQTLTHLYLPFSQSTQHVERETYTGVMAMDWQDTYVSVLSGLSSSLGLGNTEAGFLLDNVGDNNLSMYIPIIFHSAKGIKCGLRGVLGSNDAFLNGQILYNLIVRALNVSAAIEYPRYYSVHDGVVIEKNERHSMDVALQARIRPMISSLPIDDSSFIKSVNAITKTKDSLSSHSDSRGNGIASRF